MPRLLTFLLLATLAGCSTDTTTKGSETYIGTLSPRERGDKMEADLLSGLGFSPDVTVTEATCPEIAPDEPGTYLCDVVAEGFPFHMQVRLTPEPQPDGSTRTKVVTTTLEMASPDAIAAMLAEQIRAQSGLAVDIACDGPPIRPSTPGDRFACAVTDRQSGARESFVVTLKNSTGGFDASPGTL